MGLSFEFDQESDGRWIAGSLNHPVHSLTA